MWATFETASTSPLDLIDKDGETLLVSQTTWTLTPPLTLNKRYQGLLPWALCSATSLNIECRERFLWCLPPSALPHHLTLSVEDISSPSADNFALRSAMSLDMER